jgi:hypothetical protein
MSVASRLHVLVALRRWSDAAQLLEDTLRSMRDDERPSAWKCLASLFRQYGGKAEPAATDPNETCRLVGALAPVGDREKLVEFLRSMSNADRDLPVEHYWPSLATIGWMAGIRVRLEPPVLGLVSSAFTHMQPAWAMPFADEVTDPAQTAVWRVARDVLRGDFDKARRDARRYATGDHANEVDHENAGGLLAGVQLRAGDMEIERSSHFIVKRLLAVRRGVVDVAEEDLHIDSCRGHDASTALLAAADGDGAPLASLLEECRGASATSLPLLIAIAPRVQRSRQRLGRAVTLAITPLQPRISLFEIVHLRALMRDVQRGLGATEEAARLQRIIDRHMAAFSSREQLTALILLDDLMHF